MQEINNESKSLILALKIAFGCANRMNDYAYRNHRKLWEFLSDPLEVAAPQNLFAEMKNSEGRDHAVFIAAWELQQMLQYSGHPNIVFYHFQGASPHITNFHEVGK